ncbi:MAG: hypothetical protein ACRDUA_13935 [Micromonosporaceae bacterium]
MPTSSTVGRTDLDTGSGTWSLVDDPVALRRFVSAVIDRHHRVVLPGEVADQCSCGRPFMLCPIAPLADSLLEQRRALY